MLSKHVEVGGEGYEHASVNEDKSEEGVQNRMQCSPLLPMYTP